MDTSQAVLVGHAGAGPLLPKLGEQLGEPAAFLLVDSDLPKDGYSRFDMFDDEQAVEEYRKAAAEPFSPRGRLAPQQDIVQVDEKVREWPLDLLREALTMQPDGRADVQTAVFAGKRPTPVEVMDEPLPVPENWPNVPVGYIHLSKTYSSAASAAREQGWPVLELSSSHVQMLLEPESFARELASFAEGVVG
tara:strand:+ start:785 stop:1360 length:576 start_codon:yes stop_codon:yes gene_type:complete